MSVADKIEKRLPGYPKGHPEQIRQAAAAFRTLSQGVGNLADAGQKSATTRTADWQDPTKDAFFGEWNGFRGALDELAGHLVDTADKLDKLADDIDDAKRKYDAAIIAVGVTVTVGVAFTFLTAGLSDEAAAAAVEAEVSGVAATLDAAMSMATQLLATSSELIGSTATRLIVSFVGNVAAQSFADVIVYPDHNPFSHIDLETAATTATGVVLSGGLAGLFGRLGESGTAVNRLSRVGGATLGGAGFDAASQEFLTGKVNWVEVAGSGVAMGVGEGFMPTAHPGGASEPEPGAWGPSRNNGSARAKAYELQITGRSEGYYVDEVEFDGYDYENGVLLEAKGPGMEFLVKDGEFRTDWADNHVIKQFLEKAEKQLYVADGRPVQWVFADQSVADATRRLFADNDIVGIKIVVVPANIR